MQTGKETQSLAYFGMNETIEDTNDHRNYNTTVIINSEGEIVSSYRKTHLYDAFGYKGQIPISQVKAL